MSLSKICLKFVFIFSHFSLIFAYILHYTAVCSSDSISIFFIQLPEYSYVISLFAHTHKNLSPTAYTHTPNGNIEVIDLLTDSAFYTHLLQQDLFFQIIMTHSLSLSADPYSLFEMLNKIRECGSSRLIIDLSSSAVSITESERFALKEQLSVLLAVLFPSEFPRYRAVDTVNLPLAKALLFNNIDFRRRIGTDPVNLTTYSSSAVPTETRNEGKYTHILERSFISKTALNFDRLFAEHTEHIKQESLKERCYAPEYIILQALQTYSLHVSRLLYAAEQNLVKIFTFDVAKGDHNTDPASFFILEPR